jgi:hypothetical protein
MVDGEHHVMVRASDQAFLPTGQPFFASVGGALRAAPVPAGIADELTYVAVGATKQMATHGRGAAITQALGSVPLLRGQRVRTSERLEVLLENRLD